LFAFALRECNFLGSSPYTIATSAGTFQNDRFRPGSFKVALGYSLTLVGANGEAYNTTTTSVKVRFPGGYCGDAPPSEGPIVTFEPIGWSALRDLCNLLVSRSAGELAALVLQSIGTVPSSLRLFASLPHYSHWELGMNWSVLIMHDCIYCLASCAGLM
jgi:hypothetical protein